MGAVLLGPLLGGLLALVCLPVIKLAMLAFGNGWHEAIRQYLANEANVHVLVLTFRGSLIVAVLSCTIGGMVAWS